MSNLFDLNDWVAVVTGGSSGIGLSITRALLAAGARVAVWSRNRDKLARATKELQEYSGRVLLVRCDATLEEEVELALRRTIETLGPLDALVANAAVRGRVSSTSRLPLKDWQQTLRATVDSAFVAMRAAANSMVETGTSGSLVAISSLAGVMGQALSPAYAAAKGALLALVRSMSVEFGRHGIRVNAILPGWIETEMTAPLIQWKARSDLLLNRIPLRRWGTPDDVAGPALFLMSEAGRYVTGELLVVDGGFSIS